MHLPVNKLSSLSVLSLCIIRVCIVRLCVIYLCVVFLLFICVLCGCVCVSALFAPYLYYMSDVYSFTWKDITLYTIPIQLNIDIERKMSRIQRLLRTYILHRFIYFKHLPFASHITYVDKGRLCPTTTKSIT